MNREMSKKMLLMIAESYLKQVLDITMARDSSV